MPSFDTRSLTPIYSKCQDNESIAKQLVSFSIFDFELKKKLNL